MDRVKIDSKAIKQVAYNGDDLHVWFTNGFFKTYFNVPRKVYDGLIKAESKGKYFNVNIKDVFREG